MKENYEVIIVGAGIAGLISGNLLASEGKKVLVLEKESQIGGYFSGYITEDGDKIDYAISYVLSCGPEDVVTKIFKKLKIEDKVNFKRLDISDQVFLPNHQIKFGVGKENFLSVLSKEFPAEKENLYKFADWLTQFQQGTKVIGKEANLLFLKNYRRTYQEFLDSYFTDEKLKGILSLRIQADPASLMIMAGFLVECYYSGMYYPLGGVQQFANLLGDSLKNNAGDILTDTEVIGFSFEGERITGVKVRDGRTYAADNVVFNGDVVKMCRDYIDFDNLPQNYVDKLLHRKVGHSSLNVYMVVEGIDLSRFAGGRIYLSNTYNIYDIYKKIEAGEIPEELVIKIHIPTMHDPSLTKPGRHIIRIETDLYHEPTSGRTKEDYHKVADKMLTQVCDTLIANLDQHILHKRIITPLDFAEMFLHTNGSGTGWAHTVENSIVSTFKPNTPFKNLVIAGQWGEFSSGLRQIVLSGEKAASLILRGGS